MKLKDFSKVLNSKFAIVIGPSGINNGTSAKREADLKLRARLLPELYDTRSNYRKCSKLRPGRLFNFLRREGGRLFEKGGRGGRLPVFRLSIFISI